MFIPFDASLAALLLWTAAADGVPTFNVQPYCRAVAEMARPVGDPAICLRGERRAREQLVRQWRQFGSSEKATCLQRATLAPEPTYTTLLACLETERDVRKLREKGGRTIAPAHAGVEA